MTVKSCVQKHSPADNSMSAEDNVPTPCPIQYVTLYLGSIINSKTKQGSAAFEKVQITDLQGSHLPIWMVILHFTKFFRKARINKKKIQVLYHLPLYNKIHVWNKKHRQKRMNSATDFATRLWD